MKALWLMVIICLLAMAQLTSAFAAATRPERPNPEERRFIGTVVVVDDITKTLVAKTWLREVVFDVAATRFAEDGSLQDLRPGDRVFIRYIEENGKKVVGSIIKADHKAKTSERPQSGTHMAKPARNSEN